MSEAVDGRAVVGFACGLAALPGIAWVPAGFFFGPVGVIFALSSLVSTDDPPTPRTRRLAFAGMLLAAAGFGLACLMVYVSPHDYE
jgi:hypothetical protein